MDIAITGLGPVAPNGCGREEFWNSLKEGVSGIGPLTRFDASSYSSRIAGEVSIPPALEEELSGGKNNKLSLTSKFIVAASILALQDAGVSKEDFSGSNSGVWVGTTTTDMSMTEEDYDYFKENGVNKPYYIYTAYPHASAKMVGTRLCCQGPVTTASIGCSSGLFAIFFAAEALARGEVDMALAGGGDAPISPFLYSGFCEANFLSTAFNNCPQKASRPFDARRDGGVLSEGAGMVLLERADRAWEKNRYIYGYLAGWGRSNAYSYELMENAFFSSMKTAMKAARITPSEIDYICANAPGDKYIDKMEMKAVINAFSGQAYSIPISSIKSSFGNPLAAAGPLQVIAAMQAMREMFVPPTVNLEKPLPDYGLDLIPQKGRVARVKRALVNGHEFGGSNISLALTSMPPNGLAKK